MFSDFLVRTRMTTHLTSREMCVWNEHPCQAAYPLPSMREFAIKIDECRFCQNVLRLERIAAGRWPWQGTKLFQIDLNIECIWMLKKLEIPSTYNSLRSNSICVNKRFERNFFKTCCYIQFVLFVAFPAFILKCQPSNRRASWSPKPNHHDYHTNRTRRSRQLSLRIPSCWWHALATSELRKMVQPWKHIH